VGRSLQEPDYLSPPRVRYRGEYVDVRFN
jgi:hypothetical protein